jgi:hypothetical protein
MFQGEASLSEVINVRSARGQATSAGTITVAATGNSALAGAWSRGGSGLPAGAVAASLRRTAGRVRTQTWCWPPSRSRVGSSSFCSASLVRAVLRWSRCSERRSLTPWWRWRRAVFLLEHGALSASLEDAYVKDKELPRNVREIAPPPPPPVVD